MAARQRAESRDPLRTGVFGLALVVCLVLVSFGYSKLPFFAVARHYSAYFANAAGIIEGNDVQMFGHTVGSVTTVDVAGRSAKVGFTVDREFRVGDQSLAAIKTDTVLGQRSLAITPVGSGTTTTIPLDRTSTPYTLGTALQDLSRDVSELDQGRFTQALEVLTDTLRDATPQLRNALDGVAALSRSVNNRDGKIADLLTHSRSVSAVLARRSDQLNTLIDDGTTLFRELSARRQAIDQLIAGIGDVSRQLTGFVTDNRREIGPALQQLNSVLTNLQSRRVQIDQALTQFPPYSTSLGEGVSSGPGFGVNVYGLPPAALTGVLLDAVLQPGKLPDSLADFLRGFISERLIIRPKSP